jgi:tetratricopeptide (TPR) repeat protein
MLRKLTFLYLTAIVFLALGNNSAKAQKQISGDKTELPQPGQLLKIEPDGNYLAPLAALEKRESEYLASEQWRSFFYDIIAYANSYVGNYSEAIAYFDQGQEKTNPKEIKNSEIDKYTPKNALEIISSVAEKEQVVMINELHHVPMHRAFTAELLPVLYKKGFRYLAVEAVSERDTELNSRGYPVYKTGAYTIDPVFGDMLRTALRLGFKVIPYEDRRKCEPQQDKPYFCRNERERGQAQNIYDRILKENPNAKILVHAGAGHVQEYRSEEITIMAAHFKDISGIDPFTIDQTEMYEHNSPAYEEAVYRYAARKNLIKKPTIFQSGNGDFWKNQNGQFSTVDAQIFHPRVERRHGSRPTWLKRGDSRKPYAAAFTNSKISFGAQKRILVQAFSADESSDAVPIDQVIASDSKNAPVLMLPAKGDFRLRAIDENGKVIWKTNVSFKESAKNRKGKSK